MLRGLSAPQFLRWFDYEQEHPFDDRKADWLTASICAAIFNTTMITNRSPKRFRVSDFLLEFTKDTKKVAKEVEPAGQSWQQMKFIAMMCVADSQAKKRR